MDKVFYSVIALLAGIAAIFYSLQNSAELPGGQIALPKVFWLGLVIVCWYVIPAFLLSDKRLSGLCWLVGVLLGNMLLRGTVELWMMYQLHNWHPYYGIGHDILSSLVCIFLAIFSAAKSTSKSIWLAGYFLVMALLFVIEAGFAWYMLTYVQSATGESVYYVPATGQHSMILTITSIVIIATLGYLFVFIRKWFYAAAFER
jgi:hypothetical protein